MSQRVRAAVGGCLVQGALLLAALLPLSRQHPPALLAILSGLAIGFVGGFVAGKLHGDDPSGGLTVGLPVGAVGGVSFTVLLYYLIVTDTASGVFWHFHYLLAITVPPTLVAQFGAATVAGFAALCGLAVGGFAVVGGWLSTNPRISILD